MVFNSGIYRKKIPMYVLYIYCLEHVAFIDFHFSEECFEDTLGYPKTVVFNRTITMLLKENFPQ